MTDIAPPAPNPNASTYEAFNGLRIELPHGAGTFVARKVLLFQDATRWLELLDRYGAGARYSDTLKIILDEMVAKLDPEDMAVLNALEIAEVVDHVISRFFSHRRTLPPWIAAALGPELTARLTTGSRPT